MKRFLIIAICLLGLAIPQVAVSSANSPIEMAASDDGWSSLGRIDLHIVDKTIAQKYGTATLLVKEVGNRLFYKIRYKQNGQSHIVSVIEGSWDFICLSCGGKQQHFNGKAGNYYLIIP